jgi:transaldolase/glucose-6-phosphate isomerase
LSRLKTSLPESLATAVKTAIGDWQSGNKMQRLWQHDASLWTGDDEAKWLGWLDVVEEQIANPVELRNFAKEVWSAGFKDILLLGMGGSSLCPEVLRMTYGKIAGYPDLHVLDSTDPAQVKAFENKIDIGRTLFIVSSKSGSTLEPNIFKQYFFERTKQVVGADKAGSHFVAITDPGSKMQQVAEGDRFRHIFFGKPSIGGRYSALSHFGMVPAAAIGVDTKKFLDRAQEMVRACGPSASVEANPGAVLGIILGTAARSGRDKVTIITSPDIADLGAWLEQLMAESTGKVGKGIIPVDREELAAPEVYCHDRVFAYIHTKHATDVRQDAKVAALEAAGHAVLRIAMSDIYDLGAEFFCWEIATAVAGSIIGINAFNQPDVEASKIATRNLTSAYEKTGSLPRNKPVVGEDGIKLFTDEKNAAELARGRWRRQVFGGIFESSSGSHWRWRLLCFVGDLSR